MLTTGPWSPGPPKLIPSQPYAMPALKPPESYDTLPPKPRLPLASLGAKLSCPPFVHTRAPRVRGAMNSISGSHPAQSSTTTFGTMAPTCSTSTTSRSTTNMPWPSASTPLCSSSPTRENNAFSAKTLLRLLKQLFGPLAATSLFVLWSPSLAYVSTRRV